MHIFCWQITPPFWRLCRKAVNPVTGDAVVPPTGRVDPRVARFARFEGSVVLRPPFSNSNLLPIALFKAGVGVCPVLIAPDANTHAVA